MKSEQLRAGSRSRPILASWKTSWPRASLPQLSLCLIATTLLQLPLSPQLDLIPTTDVMAHMQPDLHRALIFFLSPFQKI